MLKQINKAYISTEWRTKKETEILMAHKLRNIIGRKIIFTQSDRKFSKLSKNIRNALFGKFYLEKFKIFFQSLCH